MEEDYALTQTQTTSQVQQNLERFSGTQVDQKVGGPLWLMGACSSPRAAPSFFVTQLVFPLQVSELVQFLLIKDQKKIPIRRAGKRPARWSQSLGWGFHSPFQVSRGAL